MVQGSTWGQEQRQKETGNNLSRKWEWFPSGDCPKMFRDLLDSDKANKEKSRCHYPVPDRAKSSSQGPVCSSVLILSPIRTCQDLVCWPVFPGDAEPQAWVLSTGRMASQVFLILFSYWPSPFIALVFWLLEITVCILVKVITLFWTVIVIQ